MQNAKLKAIFVTFFLAAVSMICFGQQDKETERSPKLIFNPVKDIYILGDRIELTVTNTPEITNRREFDEIYAVINDKKNIKVRDLSKNLASTTKYIEFYLKDIDLGTTKIYCRIKRFKNIYRKEVKEEFVTNSVYVEVASNEIMFVNEERFCPAHKIKLKKVPIHYGLKCPKEQKEKGEIICGGCVISPKSEKFAYICPVDHWIWERVME